MAGGTLTVSGMSASEPAGQRTFGPLTIQGTQVIAESLWVPLASGDNTFAVPASATAVMIIPPLLGTVAIKLRTNLNAADVGLPLNTGQLPFVYPFPAVIPTSLIINAAGAQVTPISIVFI